MVFELEYLRAETLVFLMVKSSELPVGRELILIELGHYNWVLLHFSQESIYSFIVIFKQFGLDLVCVCLQVLTLFDIAKTLLFELFFNFCC